ncbi:M56 family metallopeptidase [Fusibacillus kribbianus]|uniref:M56 family metallopeptidase n=1 Tax=Fusibacillus kribbianus TaxID=3044208 RepID=A0AAP4B7B7_9FIRM|nr:M56 family metallopeptidase [Ruminococcus sp. YH-rum2234]MDI9240965.1 M56 family metallopeptidase [Ruminococcus sp. YH-rum2234]
MILIDIFLMIFLTSVTGSVILAFWKPVSLVLDRFGEIRLIRRLLWVVIAFHLIPVVFLWFLTATVGSRKAGRLFSITPFFLNAFKVIAVLWLAGFLWKIFKYLEHLYSQWLLLRLSYPGGAQIRKKVDEIRGRLGIRKEISVWESEEVPSPFISGFLKYRIFIPKQVEDEEELDIILEHELCHFRQGDLHLKKLCMWIVRIQWFNPFVYLLRNEVDRWGESLCDYEMCYGREHSWKMKKYFDVVIKYCEETDEDNPYAIMYLGNDYKEIKRRIERMKKMTTRKTLKRASAVLLILCFALASAVTSMAAGKGVETLYGMGYDLTMVRTFENRADEPEMEEFTRVKTAGMDIVQTDEPVYLDERGLNSYTWTLDPGEIYETGLFYASNGDTIEVNVSSSPKSSNVGVGLDQPNGILRGVSGTCPYAHTFTVNQNGFHRVYAENLMSSKITVVVTVSR